MLKDYGFGRENIDDEYNEVYDDYRALNDKIAKDLPSYTPEEDDGKNDVFADEDREQSTDDDEEDYQ